MISKISLIPLMDFFRFHGTSEILNMFPISPRSWKGFKMYHGFLRFQNISTVLSWPWNGFNTFHRISWDFVGFHAFERFLNYAIAVMFKQFVMSWIKLCLTNISNDLWTGYEVLKFSLSFKAQSYRDWLAKAEEQF